MKGIEKRCGCRGADGKRLNATCPLLERSGHGTYLYRIDLGPGLDAKGVFQARRQELRAGFGRKKDAEQARAEHLTRLGQGQAQARSARTVGAYLQEWLENKVDLRPNTRRSYESHLRLYFLPHLGHLRLEDLDAGHVERMYAALRVEQKRKVGVQDLAKAAGLPRNGLHDLRHGAASLQIAAGVDLAIVSKRLRHSSLSITADTYTHLLEGVGRQAAEAARAMVPITPRVVRGDDVVSDV
ncbi:MAG: phage integrase [Frankiales bacterium]|nr:phage integrase [Frankiales bacterium]